MLYNKSRVELVFYETESGRMPVRDALDELSKPDRAKVKRQLEVLELLGHGLGMPHVKPLRDKLKELRFQICPGQFRVFFFFHTGNKAILVHSILKKTQTTPKSDMDLALSRMYSWRKANGG